MCSFVLFKTIPLLYLPLASISNIYELFLLEFHLKQVRVKGGGDQRKPNKKNQATEQKQRDDTWLAGYRKSINVLHVALHSEGSKENRK